MDIYLFGVAVIIIVFMSLVAPKRPITAFVGMMLTFFVYTDLALKGMGI